MIIHSASLDHAPDAELEVAGGRAGNRLLAAPGADAGGGAGLEFTKRARAGRAEEEDPELEDADEDEDVEADTDVVADPEFSSMETDCKRSTHAIEKQIKPKQE